MLDVSIVADSFRSPEEVINANRTAAEKRGVLADWASDFRAVEDHPGLRRLDDGSVIAIDRILDALRRLSEEASRPPRPRRRRNSRLNMWWRRHDDDDDDPPFAPAGVWRPRPGGFPERAIAAAV